VLRTIAADTRGVFIYSPDGQYLLTDESFSRTFLSYIQQINIWRAADGQRVATFPTDTFVSCAAFASKSNVFAYGTWKGLKIFRLRQY
jgi:hypothetical protein